MRTLRGLRPIQSIEEVLASLGTAISGATPRNLKPLEEQVAQTVKLLREPVVEAPVVELAGVEIRLDEVASGLETGLEKLRAKREELDFARKAVVESKVLLDQALEEFQGTFPWIAQALEAYARRVGQRELAERIRTSIRRVTRRQAEGEDPSETVPADSGSPDVEAVPDSGATPGEEPAGAEVPSSEAAPAIAAAIAGS